MEEAYATWHFNIILISLRVEVAQISDFKNMLKSCRFEELFLNLNLPHSTLGKKVKLAMACFEVAAFLQTAGKHYIWNIFLANVITGKYLLLGKLQIICHQYLKNFNFFSWPHA